MNMMNRKWEFITDSCCHLVVRNMAHGGQIFYKKACREAVELKDVFILADYSVVIKKYFCFKFIRWT